MYPGTCEHCGGSANWTVIGGIVHYYCQAECDGFRQIELDLRDPVVQDRADLHRRGASREVSQSPDLSDSHLPTSGPGILPLFPTLLEAVEPLESPSRRLRRSPGSFDAWRARLAQLVGLLFRVESVPPESDDPR